MFPLLRLHPFLHCAFKSFLCLRIFFVSIPGSLLVVRNTLLSTAPPSQCFASPFVLHSIGEFIDLPCPWFYDVCTLLNIVSDDQSDGMKYWKVWKSELLIVCLWLLTRDGYVWGQEQKRRLASRQQLWLIWQKAAMIEIHIQKISNQINSLCNKKSRDETLSKFRVS